MIFQGFLIGQNSLSRSHGFSYNLKNWYNTLVWKYLYFNIITRHHKAKSFIILVSFLITFVISRIVVWLIDAGKFPDLYIYIGETHVHHLNLGIFLLSISGFLAIVTPKHKHINLLAIAFGIGLGLTFDEFALWLLLQDHYYARISYEAIITITLLLIQVIYFSDLWQRIFRFVFKRGRFQEILNEETKIESKL